MNPQVQVVAMKNMTPTPFITCYLEDGEEIRFDVDRHTNDQIVERLVKTLGKSKETLLSEARAEERLETPAHFGKFYDRHCICTQPGQVPCPMLAELPHHWRGKFHFKHSEYEEGELEARQEKEAKFTWDKVKQNQVAKPDGHYVEWTKME